MPSTKKEDPDLNVKDFADALEHQEDTEEGGSDESRMKIVKKPRNIDTVNDFPEVREFTVENNDVKQTHLTLGLH